MEIQEKARCIAFGNKGLGNHIYGSEHNLEELCEEELDLWQDVMFSPNKMVVSGFGVEDHESFVALVDTYMGNRINIDAADARGNRFLKRERG